MGLCLISSELCYFAVGSDKMAKFRRRLASADKIIAGKPLQKFLEQVPIYSKVLENWHKTPFAICRSTNWKSTNVCVPFS